MLKGIPQTHKNHASEKRYYTKAGVSEPEFKDYLNFSLLGDEKPLDIDDIP